MSFAQSPLKVRAGLRIAEREQVERSALLRAELRRPGSLIGAYILKSDELCLIRDLYAADKNFTPVLDWARTF